MLSSNTEGNYMSLSDMTLSDENVVKNLILMRSLIDITYNHNTNVDLSIPLDVFEMNYDLMALYSSLDAVVEECEFREKNMRLLEMLYEGNTISDVCRGNSDFGRSATYDMFNRMVSKIVDKNNEMWSKTIENSRKYIK